MRRRKRGDCSAFQPKQSLIFQIRIVFNFLKKLLEIFAKKFGRRCNPLFCTAAPHLYKRACSICQPKSPKIFRRYTPFFFNCSPPKTVRGIVLRVYHMLTYSARHQILIFIKFQFLGEQLKKNGL
eukprot:sb/3475685/